MQSHAKVVVIGGGVVGCSILFHLAKFGWKDAVLLERDELTSGSSWHAAGQIHTISSDPNISRLQGYTINLYKEIEETSGQSVSMHSTGGFYLASDEDWHDYLKRERSKARYMGLDQEFISVEEAARRHPLIDPSRYVAALWDPLDGDIDPSGVTYAYAKSAQHYGAKFHTHSPVVETNQRPDGTWDVVTPKGTINAEMIVNAGGLWARELGHLAGVDLPVQPMEHHFLITETIPEIAERSAADPIARLPAGIDYEGNIYFRQEQQGMLLGTYEPSSTPWKVAGTHQDFSMELLPPDLDRIADRLEMAFERIPALGRAGIKQIINGPFTFGPFATPEWGTTKASENYERRFKLTFPNETLPKGRRQATTALYDRLVARGAVMGDAFGLENVLWFANGPDDAHEEPTFKRSRAHDYVAAEVTAVREAVGAVEIANFAKHEFTGPGSRAFLDYVLAGRVPKPGRLNLTPMLTPKGKLYGDLTVACLDDETFMLFGSGAAQEMHRRWFDQHLEGRDDFTYRNRSDEFHGIGIAGPNSRELLSSICRLDVAGNALKFRDVRRTHVGGVPVILNRISFSGELGFEIYCPPQFQLRLFEAIEEAGTDLGLKLYGARALMALRLEKNWGAWTLDFRPDYTAAQSGLDIFIQWDKDFIGKAAAEAEAATGPDKKLVTMVIDTSNAEGTGDIDVSNDEAIFKDGDCVGYITSGGYAHHVGKSMALGYVPPELAVDDTELEVEILGAKYPARVTSTALYDPNGGRMRG